MKKLRYFVSRILVALTLSFWTSSSHAVSSIPVMIGGEPEFDACGGVGEVRNLNPHGDGFLAVRKGPGTEYSKIDRLTNGSQVYFCDKQGEWIGIVYGKSLQDCGVSSPVPRKKPYIGPCQSGWAHRKWLVMIAG